MRSGKTIHLPKKLSHPFELPTQEAGLSNVIHQPDYEEGHWLSADLDQRLKLAADTCRSQSTACRRPTSDKKYCLSLTASTSSRRRDASDTATDYTASPWDDEVPLGPVKALLLSQLASSISNMKSTCTQLQTLVDMAEPAASAVWKTVNEELDRMSNLHMRIALLLGDVDNRHEYAHGAQFSGSVETWTSFGQKNDIDSGQTPAKQLGAETLVKSYQGIISSFYDEVQKKGAVMEALKEALAKSMLKEEKLQRRVKSLEAKLAAALRPQSDGGE